MKRRHLVDRLSGHDNQPFRFQLRLLEFPDRCAFLVKCAHGQTKFTANVVVVDNISSKLPPPLQPFPHVT